MMQGTLAHWRAWAKSIQDRFIMYNPDIARPARRIYVGGLPDNTHDVRFCAPFFSLLFFFDVPAGNHLYISWYAPA
jgi:hypothetical protein